MAGSRPKRALVELPASSTLAEAGRFLLAAIRAGGTESTHPNVAALVAQNFSGTIRVDFTPVHRLTPAHTRLRRFQ
jgi:hypothetical protein